MKMINKCSKEKSLRIYFYVIVRHYEMRLSFETFAYNYMYKGCIESSGSDVKRLLKSLESVFILNRVLIYFTYHIFIIYQQRSIRINTNKL